MALAGEVEGLKPKAITESFTEPRTYIVDRTGNAVEVVSIDKLLIHSINIIDSLFTCDL